MNARAGGRLRVLLVDDTADIRTLLRTALELDGRFEVVGEAGDGRSGVDEALRLRPDVVVMDLAMPVLDGLQATPAIVRALPETRVVVLSGFDATQIADEALALGACAYVEKGTAFTELADVIVASCAPASAAAAEAPETQVVSGPGAAGALDELVSVFVHELQTPIAVVQGFAATLRTAVDRLDRDAVVAAAEAVERNAVVLGELVRVLSDCRAAATGHLELRLEPIDVGSLVETAVADLRAVTAARPVEVRRTGEAVARADRVRLRQVVTNLVSNAAKFSAVDAPIVVDVRRDARGIEVAVQDHGPGIPADRAEAVFEPFVRFDTSVAGTGLGLPIARAIARAHGGDLALEPSPGRGARFVLSLPAAA